MKNYNNPQLEYIATQGCDGEKPFALLKYFPSGYVFFREHFAENDFQNATWMSLKAGYTTRVHKHQDDLSICLYSKGHDIFIDPGMYNFVPRNTYKDYMESPMAHTTIGIRNQTYSICSGNGEKSKILAHRQTSEYDFVKAVSFLYDDVVFYRNLYYLRPLDIIVIYDEIISEYSHDYAQYFHLGSDIKIENNAKASFVNLQIADTMYVSSIMQVMNVDSVDIFDGNKTEPVSFTSSGFSTMQPTQTLAFSQTGKNVDFITVVDIHPKSIPACKYQLKGDKLSIEKGGNEVCLPINHTVPVDFHDISCMQDENSLTIINNNKAVIKHTAYVFDEETSSIQRYSYTEDRELKIDCDGFTDAKIMYYVSSAEGCTRKGLLGEWHKDAQGNLLFERYEKIRFPYHINYAIHKKDEYKYIFTVMVEDYQIKPSMKWWVYRNGALYSMMMNNTFEFEAQLNLPGNYVIMCSASDKYFGEYLFYQYDEIKINS